MSVRNDTIVFVIDDDDSARKSLHALIQAHGFQCQSHESAEDFLAAFRPGLQACVVTDLRMPGMSGAELQRAIGEHGGLPPVIVVTGHADVPTAVDIMNQGAITLLEKPFQPAELIAAITRAIQVNEQELLRRQRRMDLQSRYDALTDDEREVLHFMIEGAPNKTIADQLHMGLRTCDRRRRSVLDKMRVDTAARLAALMTELNLLNDLQGAEDA